MPIYVRNTLCLGNMTHPLISNRTQLYLLKMGIETEGRMKGESLDAIRTLCFNWISNRHPNDEHLNAAMHRLLTYIEQHWEEYEGDTKRKVNKRDNRSPLQKTTLTYLCALMDFKAAPEQVQFGERIMVVLGYQQFKLKLPKWDKHKKQPKLDNHKLRIFCYNLTKQIREKKVDKAIDSEAMMYVISEYNWRISQGHNRTRKPSVTECLRESNKQVSIPPEDHSVSFDRQIDSFPNPLIGNDMLDWEYSEQFRNDPVSPFSFPSVLYPVCFVQMLVGLA